MNFFIPPSHSLDLYPPAMQKSVWTTQLLLLCPECLDKVNSVWYYKLIISACSKMFPPNVEYTWKCIWQNMWKEKGQGQSHSITFASFVILATGQMHPAYVKIVITRPSTRTTVLNRNLMFLKKKLSLTRTLSQKQWKTRFWKCLVFLDTHHPNIHVFGSRSHV